MKGRASRFEKDGRSHVQVTRLGSAAVSSFYGRGFGVGEGVCSYRCMMWALSVPCTNVAGDSHSHLNHNLDGFD